VITDVSEIVFGENDKRIALIQNLITRRSREKPAVMIVRSQKVGLDWVESEVKEEEPPNEFQVFCRDYLNNGVKWADWVKDSPELQGEAEVLWKQLALIASMKDDSFEVPCRMIRTWQKALSRRILCHGQTI
jgi:hypothetical protein